MNLPQSLINLVLSFIEDKAWMLTKKRSRHVFSIIQTTRHFRTRLFHVLYEKHDTLTEHNVKRCIRMIRIVLKCVPTCTTLQLKRTLRRLVYICNQTRILCVYCKYRQLSVLDDLITLHHGLYGSLLGTESATRLCVRFDS